MNKLVKTIALSKDLTILDVETCEFLSYGKKTVCAVTSSTFYLRYEIYYSIG